MTHPNKKKGNGFEYRFLAKMEKQGCTETVRHWGSLGTMDVEWTDTEGVRNEAQLKFSTKKLPKVYGKARKEIVQYAKDNPDKKIWIITKLTRKPEVWERIE